MTLRFVTWNVERKRPTSARGADAVRRVLVEAPDIAVLTEAWIGHLGDTGHHVVSQLAPLPRHHPDERKVVMWSKNPWTEVCDLGHEGMPVGRFVAGTTNTALGPVRVMGICIPWHMCDVRYGSADREPWEQHIRWLECFTEVLADHDPKIPLIVAGDFNQRIPRKWGNKAAAAALEKALGDLDVVTAGTLTGLEGPGIDHIALSSQLAAEKVWGWRRDHGGRKMSDHDAAAATVSLAGRSTETVSA